MKVACCLCGTFVHYRGGSRGRRMEGQPRDCSHRLTSIATIITNGTREGPAAARSLSRGRTHIPSPRAPPRAAMPAALGRFCRKPRRRCGRGGGRSSTVYASPSRAYRGQRRMGLRTHFLFCGSEERTRADLIGIFHCCSTAVFRELSIDVPSQSHLSSRPLT